MEFGSIEREIYVEASPETVFEVVSSPERITQWWPDGAHYDVAPGSAGEIRFGDPEAGGGGAAFTVVDVQPPRLFLVPWAHPAGPEARGGHSLVGTFRLAPARRGT